jgi:hypothetical protein
MIDDARMRVLCSPHNVRLIFQKFRITGQVNQFVLCLFRPPSSTSCFLSTFYNLLRLSPRVEKLGSKSISCHKVSSEVFLGENEAPHCIICVKSLAIFSNYIHATVPYTAVTPTDSREDAEGELREHLNCIIIVRACLLFI